VNVDNSRRGRRPGMPDVPANIKPIISRFREGGWCGSAGAPLAVLVGDHSGNNDQSLDDFLDIRIDAQKGEAA
jgi:hypothetical protein